MLKLYITKNKLPKFSTVEEKRYVNGETYGILSNQNVPTLIFREASFLHLKLYRGHCLNGHNLGRVLINIQ